MKKAIILLIIIALPIILLGTTYTVIQNGTGDFITIQDAIDYVVDDDKIIVYEGTYNEQIYFLGKNIVVESRYPTTGNEWYIDNTIISYQSNPYLGVVNFSDGEQNAVIDGFTIQDGFIGLQVNAQGSPTIQNCKIQNNDHGIFVRGSSASPDICNNQIFENSISGISCYEYTYPNIVNNLITINNWGVSAQGIIDGGEEGLAYPTIVGNKFDNNYIGLKLQLAIAQTTGNLFISHDYVIHTQDWILIFIRNCTIYDNQQFYTGPLINVNITNSIIRNLVIPVPQEFQISYSNLEGVYTGIGNIDEDPLFGNPGLGDFTLKWNETEKSPCIDTGNPDPQYNDPDDTRADMGALYHPHEVKTYEFPDLNTNNGWKWLCFDIMDITLPGENNTVDPLLDPIRWDLIRGYGQSVEFYYEYPNWYGGDHEITSPQGFKFQTENECEFDISGFRCDPATFFNLYANAPDGNWIGYFLEETQLVYDAFGDYLDNIYKIKAQTWGIEKVNGVWPPLVAAYTLSPGDMVVVYCERDISEFCWSFEEAREEYIVPKSQDFTYTEEVDYIPIFISLNPEDMPSEIGAYVEGECKGATVVQDTTTQICAYILENQGETLEFEFSYGGRGVNTRFNEYTVFDPETGYRETTTINLREKQKSYYVSFKPSDENETGNLPILLSSSNYPNPFNPTTTIAYSLPNDGMIELRVYNIKGQLVKTLVSGEQLAGSYEVVWNGKDNNDKSVSSGIYFYKLSTRDETIMKKILMLK
ncbi:MAG: T9SS type A sorting domain-containing protein [Candidatus Cloacimonetes bacterium]|nr:T9SS type A sorting domain-containing protein [Candidatus Cloacimonadota bacterium]